MDTEGREVSVDWAYQKAANITDHTLFDCAGERRGTERAVAAALRAEREATARRCAEIAAKHIDGGTPNNAPTHDRRDCPRVIAEQIRAEFGITEKP